MPGSVDDAFADVAVIFHWQPSAMDGWSLTELMQWRERARVRSGATEE
ncbi:GpE family phage tail protein [Pandoraea cepalis]|uniref:GpE family phage tail protein n=1 Tax=Pandoraea cepalis TaxID=2508294 RepID=A0AAW7MJM5_9BURK|nr:GpE family phage tail protein [Pandoraea cepalis]MDN4572899.1 GpE family phage tail protein [Pandoraea cepalis]MDN4577262.1 GpE family phage tail protein [Pandoraea cepalis]